MDQNENLKARLKEYKELQNKEVPQSIDVEKLKFNKAEYETIELLDIQQLSDKISEKSEEEYEEIDESILQCDNEDNSLSFEDEIKHQEFIIEETVIDEEAIEPAPVKKKIKLMVIDHRPSPKLPRKYNSLKSISQPNRTESSIEELLCPICGIVCETKAKYFGHIQRHNAQPTQKPQYKNSKSFECSICHESFQTRANLLEHRQIHKQQNQYTCNFCGKTFKAPSFLKVHSYTHTGTKPFECELCGKRSVSRAEQAIHMRFHTGERPYQCAYCNKRFPSQSARSAHQYTHTAVDDQFECEICGQKFRLKVLYKRHLKCHATCIKCDYCDRTFTSSKHIRAHMRMHPEFQPFQCKTCGKCFRAEKNLIVHERIHIQPVNVSVIKDED